MDAARMVTDPSTDAARGGEPVSADGRSGQEEVNPALPEEDRSSSARTFWSALTRKAVLRCLGPVVAAVIFGAAAWVLYRELRGFRYEDVAEYLASLSPGYLLLAFGLTALAYGALVWHDVLALRYVQCPLPYKRVALPALIGFAVSNTVGQAWLSGGAVRYRIYRAAGLSAGEIGRVVVFVMLTFWLGYVALGAALFPLAPPPVPDELELWIPLRVLGWACFAALVLYLAWCAVGCGRKASSAKRALAPSLPMALTQVTLSVGRTALTAGVLYALLLGWPGVHYLDVLGAFVLAIAAGGLSQVPGGAGVLEAGEDARAGRTGLDRARDIVCAYPAAKANLALLGDKRLLFNYEKSAFVMYGVRGRSWVALGDPVGPPEEAPTLIRWFYQECVERGARPVFHEARAENLPIYENLGLRPLEIAEEGRVLLASFSLAGPERRNLRNAVRKAEKEGCTFEWAADVMDDPSLLPELRAVSDAWLASKHTREKRFSIGYFDEDYLSNFSLGVVRQDGRPIAFVTVWEGDSGEELYLDLMRFLPDVPRGTMDLLFVRLMEKAQAGGYAWFNVGMSPLSGPVGRAHHPLWGQVYSHLLRRGERFYNVQGLRQYKEKFDPQWEPRYLLAPGGLALVRALADVAALSSGGLRGMVAR
ncbi:MAG: GNAT family N-acetyltransferase [Actinobacteria bacterium]|nr:GNAT family N-acetyltransferase [Actinomycetota bacterium]